MILVTVHDVEELTDKLVSDKAKIREEGLKTLQGYLNSTGDVGLWKLLDQETAVLDPNRIRSSSWPGLLHALCSCIESEVAASKKKGPKLLLAKTLRNFILKAEDSSHSGINYRLLRKVKRLFQHVVQVVERVPSFLSDYNNVLCQLLPVFEYRMRMGKKIYADLLHFYLEKAKDISRSATGDTSLTREDDFRNISTLLSLVQYPPGDLPEVLLRDMTEDFREIFSKLRDEGRIAKKLLAALNSFIIANGLNIGDGVAHIHGTLKVFMNRLWLVTRDRELKDGLVLYARLQLNLRYILFFDDVEEVSALLDLVEKDLDQPGVSLAGPHRLDAGRDDKAGSVTKPMRSFLELAAMVLFESMMQQSRQGSGARTLNINKRRRKAEINVVIRDRLKEGKYMWAGAFCLLIRRFGSNLALGVILDWLEGLASSLDRIICDAVHCRNFEGPIWTIRCLQELATLWGQTCRSGTVGDAEMSFQVEHGDTIWSSVWKTLLHWLPLLGNGIMMMEEAFRLLGVLAAKSHLPLGNIPHDVWDLHRFQESPSVNILYFLIFFFSRPHPQISNYDMAVRKKLLDWCLSSLNQQDVQRTPCIFAEQLPPRLLATALLVLTVGVIPGSSNIYENVPWLRKELSWPTCESEPYLEPEESEKEQERDIAALHRADHLSPTANRLAHQDVRYASSSMNQLPRVHIDVLLQTITIRLRGDISLASDTNQSYTLPQLLQLSAIVAICSEGMASTGERWFQIPSEWSFGGTISDGLRTILEQIPTIFYNMSKVLSADQRHGCSSSDQMPESSGRRNSIQPLTSPSTLRILQEFISSIQRSTFMVFEGRQNCSAAFERPLIKCVEAAREVILSASELPFDKPGNSDFEIMNIGSRTLEGSTSGTRIINSDLDMDIGPGSLAGVSVGHVGSVVSTGTTFVSGVHSHENLEHLRRGLLHIIVAIGKLIPAPICVVLEDLMKSDKDRKDMGDVLLSLCATIGLSTCEFLEVVVGKVQDLLSDCQKSECMRRLVLTAFDTLFNNLLCSSKSCQKVGESGTSMEKKLILSGQISSEIADLIGKIGALDLLSWSTRLKLVESISQFIILDPGAAQGLTDRFLVLLHDSEYRVRLRVATKLTMLFETWDGHKELFQDVCGSFGVKMATVTASGMLRAGYVLEGPQEVVMAETALLSLAEIIVESEQVENDAVFVVCAHVAMNPSARSLACAVIDRVGKRLKYPNRWKYMAQIFGHILTRWITSDIDVSRLLEIREVIMETSAEQDFLQECCPWVLPWLMYYNRIDQIQWLSTVLYLSIPALLKQHFEAIFAKLLPLHLDASKAVQERADAVLQGSMLKVAKMSENERDLLIQKKMVQIVKNLMHSCNGRENPQLPHFSKGLIVAAIKTTVDGFLDSESSSQEENVIDKMQIFRPDRVFKLLSSLHLELCSAIHPRHRKNLLTSLGAMLEVLGTRAIVPSTCRYLILIILQSIEEDELQEYCCILLKDLLDKLDMSGLEISSKVLGDQLQAIVSKLVSCCLSHSGENQVLRRWSKQSAELGNAPSAFSLLNRLTAEDNRSLHEFIKDLDPFPDFPCFKPVTEFRNQICAQRTFAEDFTQFVRKAPSVPREARVSSLKELRNQLRTRRKELYAALEPQREHSMKRWLCSAPVVNAAWKLVRLCDKPDNLDMSDLAGELLAAVGVGDPHAVVFHLPDRGDEEPSKYLSQTSGLVQSVHVDSEIGLSDDLLHCIIMQLRAFLIDSDYHVIQIAASTLRGILSTQKGQRVFAYMSQQEKCYLEIFFGGVNLKVVQDMIYNAKRNSSESAIPLDNPSIWQTAGKSHDVWVCTLIHSLLEHTEDTILRLCQEILAMKASLAELVFPHVFGVLAGEYSPDSDLCKTISKQVEDHLFSYQNHSARSLRLFFTTLNSLRQWYIHSGMKQMSEPSKRKESTKRSKLERSSGSESDRARSKSFSVRKEALKVQSIEGAPTVENQTPWNKVYWLDVNYLSTAKAAQQCAAYFTSVLYVEYWCEESFGRFTLGPPDFSSDDKLPLHLELLVRVYTRINEPDGVYGVVRSHKVLSQLLRYEHEGNWSKALENYDLLLRTMNPALSNAKSSSIMLWSVDEQALSIGREESFTSAGQLPNFQLHKGLMRSLQQNGCSHILEMYQYGVSQQETGLRSDAEFQEMQYEAAWRTGIWKNQNLMPDGDSKLPSFNAVSGAKELRFHAHLHSCLKSMVEGDFESFSLTMKITRQEIVTLIAHTSMESTQNVNPLIVKLQMLNCVSQAWDMRWNLANQPKDLVDRESSEILTTPVNGPLVPSREQIDSFEMEWQENLRQMQAHYELAEPYIAIYKVLLELLDLKDHIPQHLLQFGRFARKAGRLNHAGSAIHELKSICSSKAESTDVHVRNSFQAATPKYCVAGRVEEAKVLWAEGHHEMAINLVKYLFPLQSNEMDSALLLCLTGKWLAETRSSSSRIIMDSYLKKAVEFSTSKVAERSDQKETIRSSRTHFRLAHYADALFRSHQVRLSSSEWQSALRLRQHRAREYEALRTRLLILRSDPTEDPVKIREYSMKVAELHKQLSFDAEEAQHLQNGKEQFMSIALENYRSCLCISNKYDLRVVFRLISLWFNLSSNEHVMEEMLETVQRVQTFKFLPLVYQIASRLGTSKDASGHNAFQKALTFLLKKMGAEHPYHSLYQLFALANGDRVKEKQRGKNAFVVDMDKKRAAEELLGSLSTEYHDLILQVKSMIEIYIRLAEMETTPKDAIKKIPLPRDIRGIRELELVPVVTASIPVDHSCQYKQDSFAHFKGFSEGIKVMNGINAPKYIECMGSDGRKYKQLAKSGNDDLRQDAVMEQLFDLVNSLLHDHPNTRKRNLGIRTYKVIPFTPTAGVLEWVDGTVPLGEYLLGSDRLGGAHGRYGIGDWTFVKCREHMCTVKDKGYAFETVLTKFRPVMHNFFLENYAQAEDWFEKRLAYTRSVATSSMVGYVVGLGDRHSMNVLLDQATAEVVHIDLGVAFEQGLMLKTPERIPFRLTRDIVDGMGVTGTEGVFRRCCEATLCVLRTNKEAVLTIIEVFIHDPLYNWALSPLKVLQRQQELEDDGLDSSADTGDIVEVEGNKDAARALFRVKQKLDGYEEGEMRSLQGQVQQLIQDAQDPERLSQLFPGWGAWL